MSVTADASGLRDAVIERYRQVLDDAVQDLFLDMETNGPRSEDTDHEHMTSRLAVTAEDDAPPLLQRTISSPAEYSSYVDEGTGPHEIPARPSLAFTVGGRRVIISSNRPGGAFVTKDGVLVVFKDHVNHPGTPRTGWWTDRLERWSEYVGRAIGA